MTARNTHPRRRCSACRRVRRGTRNLCRRCDIRRIELARPNPSNDPEMTR